MVLDGAMEPVLSEELAQNNTSEVDKCNVDMKLFAEIQQNRITILMAELALEARNPVSDTHPTRAVRDCPEYTVEFTSLLPTKISAEAYFAVANYTYNAQTTLALSLVPIALEIAKAVLYSHGVKYSMQYTLFQKTSAMLIHIIEGKDAIGNEMYDTNCQTVEDVWMREQIKNTDADTKESRPMMHNPNNETAIDTKLLSFVLHMKQIHYQITGRTDIEPVRLAKEKKAKEDGTTYKNHFDADEEQSKAYNYDREKEADCTIHVEALLETLATIPALIMELSASATPFFGDYIPLILEKRISNQPKIQTMHSASNSTPTHILESMASAFNVNDAHDSYSAYDIFMMSSVVDLEPRQLQSDVDVVHAMDSLIEQLRRYQHIKGKLMTQMKEAKQTNAYGGGGVSAQETYV